MFRVPAGPASTRRATLSPSEYQFAEQIFHRSSHNWQWRVINLALQYENALCQQLPSAKCVELKRTLANRAAAQEDLLQCLRNSA